MTVAILLLIREVQIPLVALLLLLACVAKVRQMRRTGLPETGLGQLALFPVRMRKPMAIAMCVAEAVLGLGLIVTARGTAATGGAAAATIVRLGAGLLLLVATSTLIELRTVRPDVGCGCFGDFSTAPISGRTIARSTLLAVAILSTLGLRKIEVPRTGAAGLELLAIVCAELLLLASMSPEVGAALIRLGYTEPCELRHLPSTRSLIALRRSKPWRRYAGLIASDIPADIWRELCWRYVAYPSSYEGRPASLVFAVFLQYRRPIVQAALVDATTGLPLPLPTGKGRAKLVPPPPPPAPQAEAEAAAAADASEVAIAAASENTIAAASEVAVAAAASVAPDAVAVADADASVMADVVAMPDAVAVAGDVGVADVVAGPDAVAVAGDVGVADVAAVGAVAAADTTAVPAQAAAAAQAAAPDTANGFTAADATAPADDPDATLVDVLPRQP